MISNRAIGLRLGFLKEGQDISTLPLKAEALTPKEIGKPRESEKVEFHKRMPLPEIGLKSNEDLIVSKVKLRPALLIHCDPVNLRKQANHFAGILPKAPNPSYYVFAPIYSLRKSEVDHGFPEAFIEAVKNDEFPNMLYLPAFRTELPNDSVAVLNDPFAAGINAIEETTLQLDPLELASKLEEFGEHVQGEILLQAEEAGSAV
ncbi:hypothetical protein IEN85_02130 [Pelagicoccus sp. NFK12]|uniref:Uncharacterized protein n=1 Tax=Pelagicoccus enzymogenes TaxID=2773457 RepID=A0A927IGE0_9BACT|nr:hypothetical protein [Pelagicoccus enzymogenes]MBD5778290.1 hypothetical protein [Pelagicoccus enzymogenes]